MIGEESRQGRGERRYRQERMETDRGDQSRQRRETVRGVKR